MINRVTLIGNLGSDPEVRYMPNGGAVANVILATTFRWKDKSGEKKESTEWHRVVFFNKLAEIVGEYMKKGSRIYVEGRLQTRKWQNKEGLDCYTTEIIATEMNMLDSRQQGEQRQPEQRQQAPQNNQQQNHGGADFDDDIPFANIPMIMAKRHLI